MFVFTRQGVGVLLALLVIVAIPAFGDDVTISGNVSFASLDGSSIDHDGLANGTFTVDDGDLIVLGTIQCNDSGPFQSSACAMSFSVSGDLVVQSGGAIYAENRTGGGNGAGITFAVGGNVLLAGSAPSQAGAIVSSGNESSSAGNAGNIAFSAGGSVSFGAGSVVSAAAKGGNAGAIGVTAGGSVTLNGVVAAGPSSTVGGTKYSGPIFSGGSASMKGGSITILSNTHTEPAITVGASATIASQGGNGGAGSVILEGCGVIVNGLVASVSASGSGAKVTLRSGTSMSVDGRDLGSSGARLGMVRADALQQGAGTYSANLFAREAISILGPASGTLFAATSNGGSTSKDPSGTINVISTGAGVSASGNAFAATGSNSGDQGGTINVSAASNVTLDQAGIKASGDHATNNNDRAGGAINVRSHSGAVSWQNGSGDVRPTGSGSGVRAARQGTITITYCTSVSTSGSSFPTNGAPVGPFPTTVQACSPASPSLPPGEQHPDCNDPPVAANDAYSVAEGGTLNVAAPGVLGNDADPDGDPITAVLVSGPTWAASFTLNADGSFSYTHDGSEHHSDSFTYQATDGTTSSNIATVVITVTPVNDSPVANNDSYTVAEGGTINYAAPGVLANVTDPDGPAMSAVLVSGPAHAASFVLNADGSFIYVHDGSETTSDSFTYKANDGALDSNVATVTITINAVNDAPVANNDGPYGVNEGGTLNGTSVLANDTDAENNSLTAALVSGPANASSFVLNADGTFTYVHDGSETTSDSFTYKANDGVLDSNVATVTITITAVNDAPVANDDAFSVNEAGTLNGTSVLANDTDAENNALTAVLVSGPANASSFTLNADGTFTYVQNGSETTSDSFTYKANDGTSDSNVATVTITINAVNDAPVANGDAYSVAEGGTLSGSSVLTNDTDAENDSLTAVLVSGPANASSFVLNANGTFTYVHNGGETTSDSFTYKANDGTSDSNVATVTITITAVNDAPVANNDGYGVAEGGALSGSSVLANDTDAENSPLSAVLVTGPANASSFTLNADGTFTYLHNGSETTTDSFTYKASDGSLQSNTATVTITITPINDAPVANNDGPFSVSTAGTLNVAAPGVLGNDTDVDGPGLVAILVSGPANASSFTFNADGSFSYTSGVVGVDFFTYKANDGSLDSNIATVTINVVSLPPVAADDNFTTVGNTELRVGTGASSTPHVVVAGSVLTNDTDPDTPSGSLTVTAFDASSANGGTVSGNASGNFTYLPPVGFTGTDSFNYTVSDGSNSDTGTVFITFTGRVWYVRNNASSGDGRSHAPFNTLSAAQGASTAGDTIFVHRGDGTISGHSAGVFLQNSQRLIGEGVALVVGSYTLHPAGLRPTLGPVVLASGNTVSGLNVNATATGITGSSVSNGTISQVDVTGGTTGIALTSAGGTFTLTNVVLAPGSMGLWINAGTANVSATNLSVTTIGAPGIFGTGTGTISFAGTCTVSTTSNAAIDLSNHTLAGSLTSVNVTGGVDGIRLLNTNGTFAVVGTGVPGSGGTITGMLDRGVEANNAAGVSLRWMNIDNCGGQAVFTHRTSASASSLEVRNSSFSGNFSNAVQSINSAGGAMTVTVDSNAFTSNNAAVVAQTVIGPLTARITNNTTTFNLSNAFSVTRNATGTGVVEATITGNTIGTTGVAASGATCGGGCSGILVSGGGTNAFLLLVENNVIRHVDANGMRILGSGSAQFSTTIRNNLIEEPEADVLFGLQVQSGTSSADTTSVCAEITGNAITGPWVADVFVRNTSAGSTFSLPGYAGLGTDTTAVANFIIANNTITTATATRKTTAPANQFSGGAPCPTPAP